MKPIDFRLVSKARATAGYLVLVVALAAIATASTVAIAWSLSSFVVGVFVDKRSIEDLRQFLVVTLVAGGVRAVVHFAQEFAGFWAAGRVKFQLRAQALDVIERDGSPLVAKHGSAELGQLLGPSLDSLDVYFAKYLPQLVFTALVTPALTYLIWSLDHASGITVLMTLPLIPLFMVLIGLATRNVQEEQLEALQRLNGHFLEIVKGIVTLKVFDRTRLQNQILAEVSDQYRIRTLRVLRLSFLSGFALELAASLSVALIAVGIGLRLVEGGITLFVGLFVLIIAPEVYLPLRNVGAQFHAAAQGVAVTSKVLDLLEDSATKPAAELEIEPQPGITVIVGKSGIGKSIALKRLDQPLATWMPQQTQLIPGTIRSNITGPNPGDDAAVNRALERAQLTELPPEVLVSDTDLLSGGQRQRVGLARAFYRLAISGGDLLLLDEPTSQLDADTEARVISELRELATQGISVVAISHSRQLIGAADRLVNFD
jgi:ATP-binding cassette, subfamily C, bacterial CydD